MKSHYPAEKSIAVWVGTFASEEEMDLCTDKRIEPTLGLPVPMSSICEVSFANECVGISELLEGFSGWKTYTHEASKAADDLGVRTANGALVCFYLKCEAGPNEWEGMTFLGNFRGQDVE